MDDDERRKSIRIPLQVTVRVVRENKEYPATALNISADGISLKTTHRFQDKELIEIIFPVSENHDIKMTARVVWETRIEEGVKVGSHMGMEFEELSDEDQEALFNFLNQLLTA